MSKDQVFLFILLFFALSAASHPAEFVYSGFLSSAGNNISLVGAAEIEAGSGILRLTNETSRLIGRAFYPHPLRFKSAGGGVGAAFSFSAEFAFAIVPEYEKLGGHGLAFVIAPSMEPPGALPSQYLGLMNASGVRNATIHIVAVEFDTVRDFEFGDIDDNHVGVDLNSLASNASATAAYYAAVGGSAAMEGLNLKGGHTVLAWVDYDGAAMLLNVTVAPASVAAKPATPLLSFPVDLSAFLLEHMYVGFSASTGLLASSHYLFGWSFKMGGGAAKPLDLSALPRLPPGAGKENSTLIVAASFASVLVLVAAIVAAGYLAYKIKTADVIEPWEVTCGPHRFSYKELKRATNGFGDGAVLGFGGFGKVYKGTLPGSGEAVAVKRVSQKSGQGIREFVAEISSIGRLRHRNLVQLLGWCRRHDELLLVYDYMPNGSLDKLLFSTSDSAAAAQKPALSWPQRVRILRGVASALLYLHQEWDHVVIHRDVKASNVLLDGELDGRLGDFGLAKLHERGHDGATTRVVGTLGYLAPELTRTSRAATSADVYAFGALVLEVVCGRRPIDLKAQPEELVLVEWVSERWQAGAWPDVVDPRLAGEYDPEETEAAIKVGLLCSQLSPEARPGMRDVVRYLEGGEATEVPDVTSPAIAGDAAGARLENFVRSFQILTVTDAPTCRTGIGNRAIGPTDTIQSYLTA